MDLNNQFNYQTNYKPINLDHITSIEQILDYQSQQDIIHSIPIPSAQEIHGIQYKKITNIEEYYKQYLHDLEIKQLPGKGYGVIAKRPYQKGELILHEKAFVCSTNEDEEDEELRRSTIDICQLLVTGQCSIELDVFKQLAQTPELNALSEKEAEIINDVFQKRLDYDNVDELKQLINIIHTNTFALDFTEGSAMFLFSSRFNHSCAFNAMWHTVNDTLYICAVEDINVGDEICISYSSIMFLEEKKDHFMKGYGFECNCHLCHSKTDCWRAFYCSECNGRMIMLNGQFECLECHCHPSEERLSLMIEEENKLKESPMFIRAYLLFNPSNIIHPSHLLMYKSLRSYCNNIYNPENIDHLKKYLLPIAKENYDFIHGRLLASLYEQYGYLYLRKCEQEENPVLIRGYKQKALQKFIKAYKWRCQHGMGFSGFASKFLFDCYEFYSDFYDLDDFILLEEY